MVSPHGQLTCFAIVPPSLAGWTRILGRGDLDAERYKCLLRGFLLSRLLRFAHPHPELFAVEDRRAREAAVVRRALDLEHRVVDRLPAACERLLYLRLLVHVTRQGIVDARR